MGVGVMFLLFCSGLHFPVWDGRGRLQGHLTRDFNVSLPASARVARAVSVAYRDPGEFYAVEMARADVGWGMAWILTDNPVDMHGCLR